MLKFFPIAVVLSALLFSVCKIVDNQDSTDTIDVLKIENEEVSGWNEDANDGYVPFNPSNMETLVNGGAPAYVSKGLVEGFEQNMSKTNTERSYKGWVMDYGTPEKAAIMFNEKFTENSSTKEIAGTYAESAAILVPDTYGYQGYANFGKYVLWMKFDNYGSNKSEAKNNLLGFMEVIKGKIDSMK